MTVEVNFHGRSLGMSSKQIIKQAPSEVVVYILNIKNFSTSVSGTPTVLKVVDIEDVDTDVSGTVVGTQVITTSGTAITLPVLKSLTLGKSYRVHCNYVDGGNTAEIYEPNFIVRCEVDNG